MLWEFLQNDLEKLEIEGIEHPDSAVVCARIADYQSDLLQAEREGLEEMHPQRVASYSTGRFLAHRAQKLLGFPVDAVGRRERVPTWPPGAMGSITHSQTLAGVVLSGSLRAVGIDIERVDRVQPNLYSKLFTASEQRLLAAAPHLATMMFSAKEAGYKAIYPHGEKFIGFQEAEIIPDEATRTFAIRYLGEHAPNELLERGVGRWQAHDDHLLTLFVID